MCDDHADAARRTTARLGRRSWTLFYWQVGSFGAAVLLLTSSFALRLLSVTAMKRYLLDVLGLWIGPHHLGCSDPLSKCSA